MQKYRLRLVLPTLMLAAVLLGGFGLSRVQAQCGGDHSGMHNQSMGTYGHMGSGQMGMHGNQTPVQTGPNPGYAAPIQPPASGYTGSQDPGSQTQMMGQGGMAPGQSGHMGH